MSGAFASIIEGHWRIWILLSLVIGFNPYNLYELFYGALIYGVISICTYLGYWIGYFYGSSCIYILFNSHFYHILVISHVLYICAVCKFIFVLPLFLSRTSTISCTLFKFLFLSRTVFLSHVPYICLVCGYIYIFWLLFIYYFSCIA